MEFFSEERHQPFVFGDGRIGALLVHGFPGTPAEMRLIGHHLSNAGCTAHGILLPGFGPQIAELGNYSGADWVAAARQEWQHIQQEHEETILIGHSMGGAIALHLAAEQPPDKLILLAPFWRLNTWVAHLFLPIVARFVKEMRPFEQSDFSDPRVRSSILDSNSTLDLDDPETQRVLREDVVMPLASVLDVHRLGRAGYQLAKEVSCPTLVLQGLEDDVVLPRYTDQLVAQLERHAPVTYRQIEGDHDFPKRMNHYAELVLNFCK